MIGVIIGYSVQMVHLGANRGAHWGGDGEAGLANLRRPVPPLPALPTSEGVAPGALGGSGVLLSPSSPIAARSMVPPVAMTTPVSRTRTQPGSPPSASRSLDRLQDPGFWTKDRNLNRSDLPHPSQDMRRFLTFVKFHQVGGTSLADRLLIRATTESLKACCRQGCEICATHASLDCFRGNTCLGSLLPSQKALTVSIFREPLDKTLARYYFQKSRADTMASNLPHHGSIEEYVRNCGRRGIGEAWKRCPNEYTEILAKSGKPHAAIGALKELDVIGLTEEYDDFPVMVAIKLNWPLEWLTYKRLKTILGRPKVEDHSPQVLDAFRIILQDDIKVYEAARDLAHERKAATPHFQDFRRRFDELQLKVDQSCRFENHASGLQGLDCYHVKNARR